MWRLFVLTIVLALTVVLALICVASGSFEEPRCEAAEGMARDLESVIAHYEFDHGPLAESGWQQALSPYVAREAFIDPWGTPFVYRQRPGAYELFSLGPDGVEGTPDDQVRATQWAWSTCPSEWLQWGY